MRIVNITNQDKASLANLDQSYAEVSEMKPSEREFLTALIREKTPKKVLEIGVASGGSSVVLLNALAQNKGAKLYSLDYSTDLYMFSTADGSPVNFTNNTKTGYIVDTYPHLKKQWQLLTGGLACNFMEEIGGDIDFCLIDTAHVLPGEILDFLMVFPYLREDATLVLHDTNLQTCPSREVDSVNNMLISALSGTKLTPEYFEKDLDPCTPLPNIAGVELKNQKENLWNIFNLLTQHWSYMPNEYDISLIRASFKKHYDAYFVELFDTIVAYQKSRFPIYPAHIFSCEKTSIATYIRYKIGSEILFGSLRKKYQKKYEQSVVW